MHQCMDSLWHVFNNVFSLFWHDIIPFVDHKPPELFHSLVYVQKLLPWWCATDFLLDSCLEIVQANPEAGLHAHSSQSTLAVWQRALSSCKIQCWACWRVRRAWADGSVSCSKIWQYFNEFIVPSQTVRCPTPLALMHPRTIMLPPPCFIVATVQAGKYSSPCLPLDSYIWSGWI